MRLNRADFCGFVGFDCFAVLGGLATLCVIRIGWLRLVVSLLLMVLWLDLHCKSGGEPPQFKYEYTRI